MCLTVNNSLFRPLYVSPKDGLISGEFVTHVASILKKESKIVGPDLVTNIDLVFLQCDSNPEVWSLIKGYLSCNFTCEKLLVSQWTKTHKDKLK